MFEVRGVADGLYEMHACAKYPTLAQAKAEARSLAATNGWDYEVFEVKKVFETAADPHSARFKLEG